MKKKAAWLSRRGAMLAVAAAVGTIYGKTVAASQYGKTMLLPLDGVAEIRIQYNGQAVSVRPADLISALQGK